MCHFSLYNLIFFPIFPLDLSKQQHSLNLLENKWLRAFQSFLNKAYCLDKCRIRTIKVSPPKFQSFLNKAYCLNCECPECPICECPFQSFLNKAYCLDSPGGSYYNVHSYLFQSFLNKAYCLKSIFLGVY